MYFFTQTMMHADVLLKLQKQWIILKTLFLGKYWFSYSLKCSQPVKLQYSLIINISGKNQEYLQCFACSWPSRESRIWDYYFWLDVASSVSHPIRWHDSLITNISGKSQAIYFFLHEYSQQGKAASQTTTFS